MWFIGVEVERETSALVPEKNPGSAPEVSTKINLFVRRLHLIDTTLLYLH